MNGGRFRLLGLARPRCTWFGDLTRAEAGGTLPIEFIKCLSPEEVRARLRSGRHHSAVLVDAGVPGLDRDLVDLARTHGCAVIVVDDDRVRRDWTSIEVTAVLASEFTPELLLETLATSSASIAEVDAPTAGQEPALDHGGWRAPLIAVCGSGGTGTSTVAMALAQGLAEGDRRGAVALLDASLQPDLAMYHDVADVIPGLPELVELHRTGTPQLNDIHGLLFEIDDRGYRLLLGVRRHADWTQLRPRSLDAALDGLRRGHRVVVADVDADLEGEEATGSTEVEDRNLLARRIITTASLVVCVGGRGVWGLHGLVRTIHAVQRHRAASPVSILPVLNRVPAGPRRRAELTSALAALTAGAPHPDSIGSPVMLGPRGALEDTHLVAGPLPARLARPLAGAVVAMSELDAA